MQLIASLASGIAGAENGSVNIYARATATYATLYSTFEADTNYTPTAPVELDENGALVTYVNQFVDVQVLDTSGNVVREFGAGAAAPNVEIISKSFTGVDYVTGKSATNEPTNLQLVFDAWLASAGAADWKVLVGGAASTIQLAFASIAGIFYSVKAYGAVGDGAADDTAGIAAAAAAAQAAGGGVVFFPGGTYKTTATVTIGSKVSLQGAGAAATRVAIASATLPTFSYVSASNADWQTVKGLRLTPSLVNTGDLVSLTANAKLLFTDCYFGSANISGTCLHCGAGGDSALVAFLACTFEIGGDTAKHLLFDNGAPILIACRFVFPATYDGVSITGTKGCLAALCMFEGGVTPGAAYQIFSLNGTAPSRPSVILGCDFAAPVSGTCIAFGASAQIQEFGNRFGANITTSLTPGTPAAGNTEGQALGTRLFRKQYQAVNTTPVDLRADTYGSSVVVRTTNANQTIQLEPPPAPGSRFILTYWNNSVGNIAAVTVTGVTYAVIGLANFALNASLANTYVFDAVDINGKLSWCLTGSQLGYTP